MPDNDGDDTAFQEMMEEKERFEARFPLEAFEPMVRELSMSTTPENLKRIRGLLMPHFDYYFSSRPYMEPTREAQVSRLRNLQKALVVVRSTIS